eukprot:6751455-Prymnesium_polylepis.1
MSLERTCGEARGARAVDGRARCGRAGVLCGRACERNWRFCGKKDARQGPRQVLSPRAYIELLLVVAARVLLTVHAEEAGDASLGARTRGGLAREAELRHEHSQLQVLGVGHQPGDWGAAAGWWVRCSMWGQRRRPESAHAGCSEA